MHAETRLAIAELVIYLLLLPLIFYLLVQHGKRGLLGWLFLIAYAILRITAAGLQIGEDDGNSSTGAIVNSVGISPLLLAIAGLIHEVATYDPHHNSKIHWVIAIIFHILVATGIAIAAVGGAHLLDDSADPEQVDKDHNLQRGGYLVLLIAVVFLLVYEIATFLRLRASRQKGHATSLLFATIASMPFVATRIIYSVVYAFSEDADLSPFSGTFAVKFVLIFLVQLIAAVCLIAGGLASRNIATDEKAKDATIRLENNQQH